MWVSVRKVASRFASGKRAAGARLRDDQVMRMFGWMKEFGRRGYSSELYLTQLGSLMEIGTISGPVSLTEHRSKRRGMHIYIFGDIHMDLPRPCKENESDQFISSFLASLLRFSPYDIDLFLERPLWTKHTLQRTQDVERQLYAFYKGPLFKETALEFEPCLQVDKKDCPYLHPYGKNNRIHYADPRERIHRKTGYATIYDKLQTAYILSIEAGSDPEKRQKFRQVMRQIRRDHNKFKSAQALQKAFHLALKHGKIQKQINSIKDHATRESLWHFLRSRFTERPRVTELLEFYRSHFKEVVENEAANAQLRRLFARAIHVEQKAGRNWEAFLMDAYLLARMFRTFQDDTSPKQIVVYVGQLHAETYRAFLDSLGDFRLVQRTFAKPDTQCIDVRKFKQPFFGIPPPP